MDNGGGDNNDSYGGTNTAIISIFGIVCLYICAVYKCKQYDEHIDRQRQEHQRQEHQRQQQRQQVISQPQPHVIANEHEVISRTPSPESIYEYNNVTFKALENLGSGEWSVCSICLEPMCKEQIIQMLTCGHYYHNDCLNDWFHAKKKDLCCPMCNKPITQTV